jgi:steroid delta-isomerase
MPADPAAVRTTIDRYLAMFSAGDREGWLALWADDCTMEDPVGSPVRHGKDEVVAFYDQSLTMADSVELRPLGIVVVIGNEASFAFEVRPVLGGATFTMPAIDAMTFDDDARIMSQRAFVDATQLVPATA